MPITPALLDLHDLFTLLSDKTRLRLLIALGAGARDVGSLTREMGVAQPNVSHHLMLLSDHGLVTSRRDGKYVFYALTDGVTSDDRELLAIRTGRSRVTIRERRTLS